MVGLGSSSVVRSVIQVIPQSLVANLLGWSKLEVDVYTTYICRELCNKAVFSFTKLKVVWARIHNEDSEGFG